MQGTSNEKDFGLEFEFAFYERNIWLLQGEQYEKDFGWEFDLAAHGLAVLYPYPGSVWQ